MKDTDIQKLLRLYEDEHTIIKTDISQVRNKHITLSNQQPKKKFFVLVEDSGAGFVFYSLWIKLFLYNAIKKNKLSNFKVDIQSSYGRDKAVDILSNVSEYNGYLVICDGLGLQPNSAEGLIKRLTKRLDSLAFENERRCGLYVPLSFEAILGTFKPFYSIPDKS